MAYYNKSNIRDTVTERIIFGLTNPSNVTKIVQGIGSVWSGRKTNQILAAKNATYKGDDEATPASIETTVYDPVQQEKLDIVRNLPTVKLQLEALRAMEDGAYAFDEFIKNLEI